MMNVSEQYNGGFLPVIILLTQDCVAAKRMIATSLWYDRLWGGFRPLYCGRSWEVWTHATFVEVHVKSGRALQTVEGYPKRPFGRLL